MKPSIPDTGMVIRLERENAVIRMKGDGSCGKCGVAALGLCRGGLMQVLTVKNTERARVGDTVKIGLVQGVQFKGYVLAYVIPRRLCSSASWEAISLERMQVSQPWILLRALPR
jgi:positive regulator of sigma E activity